MAKKRKVPKSTGEGKLTYCILWRDGSETYERADDLVDVSKRHQIAGDRHKIVAINLRESPK